MQNSYFDGNTFQLIGYYILGFFITFFTFGICFPWAKCMIYSWKTKHTVIDGYRLHFVGSPIALFALWIKWWFLTLITFGIYGFFVAVDLEKWVAKNTHIEPVVGYGTYNY